MEEELALIKKLETLTQQHQELDSMIDQMSLEKYRDELQLQRMKRERMKLKEEMFKLQEAIYPDIIA